MSRELGKYYEQLAADFLHKKGLKLLTKNFHAYRGEIDLVMSDKDILVFIEVRFRKNARFGSAADSVTQNKQRHLILAAELFRQKNASLADRACRFDVIAIQAGRDIKMPPKIEWIKNAFLIT